MAVARVTEISATSPDSFDDAVKKGLERAAKTIHNIQSAWVKEQNVLLSGDRISEYKVNMLVTFTLDE